MKRRLFSKGSAIVAALGFAIVLLMIVAGIQTFSSQRIRATTKETSNLKALAVAEAGLHLVLNELRANGSFRTHTTKDDGTWDTPQARPKPSIDPTAPDCSTHGFTVEDTENGTYIGTLGQGNFRVRCGALKLQDDLNTETVDESQSYFKVEALGKVGKTFRRVVGLLEKKFLGREFLMFDGEFLSTVYGLTDTNNDTNVFTTGHLYGHKGVEIGRITRSGGGGASAGTKSEFRNISEIRSGTGGIFIYTPTVLQFRNKDGTFLEKTVKTMDFPTSPTFQAGESHSKGDIPKQLVDYKDSTSYQVDDDLKPFLHDSKSGTAPISTGDIAWSSYKEKAGADGTVSTYVSYPLSAGVPNCTGGAGSDQVVIIDFGNEVTGRPEQGVPAATSGVIYCAKSLVLRGNPKRDLIIVAEGNIYMAGDFNQRGDPAMGYKQFDSISNAWDMYGLLQKYKDHPYNDLGWQYHPDPEFSKPSERLSADANRVIHRNISIYARQRMIYDYRNGVHLFENEVFPYLKYLVARLICRSNSDAAKNVLQVAPLRRTIDFDTTSTSTDPAEDTFEKALKAQFTSDTTFSDSFIEQGYPILESTDSFFAEAKGVFASAKSAATDGRMTAEDLHKITVALMTAIRTACAADHNAGFRKLATKVRELALKDTKKEFGPGGMMHRTNYLFFPEMTLNAMFFSGAKRNATFYLGPDVQKNFDEIGNKDNLLFDGEVESGQKLDFIQRVYGSEVRLSVTDVQKITADYEPGLRRKVYDSSLPKLKVDDPTWESEIAAYRFVTWRDYSATEDEFTNF
jgi:hypothetical protein